MVLSLLDTFGSRSEPGSGQWKRVTDVRARLLASLGRLAEARLYFDSLWALAGPREAVAYSVLEPVAAGLADPSYARGPLEQLFILPADPEARQIALQRAMAFELSRGRTTEARRLGEEALAADSAPRFACLPALIEAGFGWADIIEGDTVGGLQRLRNALLEAGYAHGPVIEWSQQLRVALTTVLLARPETRAEGIRRLRYAHLQGEIVFQGLHFLSLGQALEAEGDVTGAVEAYSHFIHLWDRADPELQPRVETARRALERLRAESG
jgi:hypothetical protein